MGTGIIAWCTSCKKFMEWQTSEGHSHEVLGGDTIWEPLVIPYGRLSIGKGYFHPSIKDTEKQMKYTIARLNKLMEDKE